MPLIDELLSIPVRENAGSRASNRFSYQQVWAFNYMLERISGEEDFVLIMEYHDDVIVLDSLHDGEIIDFYQIKTNDKSSRYITKQFLKKDSKKYPDKMSIMQKLILNYSKFPEYTNSLHIVSNKKYDFKKLKCDTVSTTRESIRLSELNKENLKSLKDGMCQACIHEDSCEEQCINLINFDASIFDVVSYEDTALGTFINKLNEMGIEATVGKAKTIFNTLLSEIKRSNNWELNVSTYDELISRKTITKKDFLSWILSLQNDTVDHQWAEIKDYLLNDGFSSIIVSRMGTQWKKVKLDLMNVDNLALYELRSIISRCDITIYENYYDAILEIYEEINKNPYSNGYNKVYLYALITKEIFEC